MAESESERQYRLIDQMLSMHSMLRDRYSSQALMLNCLLLGAAGVLNAFVFVSDETLLSFGLNPVLGKNVINIASVIIFAISILELRVDWAGTARLHKEAVDQLSKIKHKYREAYTQRNPLPLEVVANLSLEFSNVMGLLPPIPESKFNHLKQKHLRKKILSERISQYPGAPIMLLRIQIWWEGIRSSTRRRDVQ